MSCTQKELDCAKRYRTRHKDRAKASRRRWRNKNRAAYNASRSRWRVRNLRRSLWMEARGRAGEHGFIFALTLEEMPFIPTHCPILGMPLELIERGGPNVPSIDRINSEHGYIPGNVWIISRRANRIKNDGTAAEHEAIARAMRAHERKESVA